MRLPDLDWGAFSVSKNVPIVELRMQFYRATFFEDFVVKIIHLWGAFFS